MLISMKIHPHHVRNAQRESSRTLQGKLFANHYLLALRERVSRQNHGLQIQIANASLATSVYLLIQILQRLNNASQSLFVRWDFLDQVLLYQLIGNAQDVVQEHSVIIMMQYPVFHGRDAGLEKANTPPQQPLVIASVTHVFMVKLFNHTATAHCHVYLYLYANWALRKRTRQRHQRE